MKKKVAKLVALTLSTCMLFTACGKKETTPENTENGKKEGDLTTIRIGSHGANFMNPYYKDPTTGEYSMSADRDIAIAAMEKVKEDLGVQIEWVQFPGETTEVLLQSVIANDPLADVVNLYANSQGTILGQNILQPLDKYLDVFQGEPPAPIYGKHYFIEVSGGKTHPLSPLFFNIDYIEQVDALKDENGRTIYPTDLYKEGKWTWSTFEDYLQKIDTHFANSQAPERPEKRIDAYRTDYTETLIQAIHSAGGAIYGDKGLAVDSPETKSAVAFVQRLVDKKLLISEIIEGTSNRPYNAQGAPFEKGESVFTNIEDWRADGAITKLADRSQSLGFIPFPRPDSLAFDDPKYQQARTGGESWAILRGVPEEKVPLAIKTYQLYKSEFGRLRQERDKDNEAATVKLKIDIYHDQIGEDMKQIYLDSVAKTEVNEFSNMTNTYWPFMTIAGDAIYGVGGSPSFDVAIESRKHEITDKIAQTEALLNTDEVKDNIAPTIKATDESAKYIFPIGTDLKSILDVANKFTVTDNLDGELNAADITVDVSAVDTSKPGYYKGGIVLSKKDSADNEGKLKLSVTIFDPNNKTAPKLTIKPDYRKIAKDEDTAAINWGNDFIEVAEDANGIDLKSAVQADLSELDTTTPGTYKVKLNLTDYAGNTTSKEIDVVVE